MNVILEIFAEEPRWQQDIADIDAAAQKVKEAVFSYVAAHENVAVLQSDKPLKVNLCLSNDAHVHLLNRDFRNMDKPTNVLSFANMDGQDFAVLNSPFAEIDLGDVIIAYETVVREAQEMQITLHDHFCHLLTHGILHILGYDHIRDDEAEHMENLEKQILQSLCIANPYEDDNA